MGVKVYDEMGRKYEVGDIFTQEMVEQPLVTERRDVYSFPIGDAEMVQLAFSGIYIVYGDLLMKQRQRLNYEVTGHIDLVEMHFTLQGNGTMKNTHSGKEHHFKANEHNMHYTPVFSGTGEYGGHERYKFMEVHFTTRFFFELSKDSSPSLMQFAESIAKGDENDLSRRNMPISFAMHQFINENINASFTGGFKFLLLK